MKRCFILLVFGLARSFAFSAEPSLMDSSTLIADAAHNPAWQDLFVRLAPAKNRLSLFEERRYFPFHKAPVVLTGEIRIVPQRGFSLHYLTPESRLIIVDRQGLLMRDVQGRERTLPADSRAQAAIAPLVDILNFNLSQLEKDFELHGWREADVWTLVFVPRNPVLAGRLNSIVISGEQAHLHKIQLIESGAQRIEIFIGETHDDAVFTDDVMTHYFR